LPFYLLLSNIVVRLTNSPGILITLKLILTSYEFVSKLGLASTDTNCALGSKFVITSPITLVNEFAVIGSSGSNKRFVIPEPISG